MTTLRQLIDSDPANAARTNAEVLAWLNELVVSDDAVRVTIGMVLARLTTTNAREALATWRTAAVTDVLVDECLIQLRTVGLDLTTLPGRAFTNVLPSGGQRSAIKALSERTAARWGMQDELSAEMGDDSKLAHIARVRT